jgi:short-subunit dehydrogenase
MYQDMTALITGASSGLGEAFARQLAEQGANLVLVARSEDTLNRLAETLRGETRVQITVLPTDFSSAAEVDRLIAKIKSRALKVDLLINNAGLGVFENFLDTQFTEQVDQVDVNARALNDRFGCLFSMTVDSR